jgi:hypothetical protein
VIAGFLRSNVRSSKDCAFAKIMPQLHAAGRSKMTESVHAGHLRDYSARR